MDDAAELDLLITVVVSADGDQAARSACDALLDRVGGRIVESADCSDEEPDCWSVTIARAARDTGYSLDSGALYRAIHGFLHELGPEYAGHPVSCQPPTAWAVIDDPDLLGALVAGGERMLVEAWASGSILLAAEEAASQIPVDVDAVDAAAGEAAGDSADVEDGGGTLPRLCLAVDVVTDRCAGAEWPARAIASRLSRTVMLLERTERPPMVRVLLDLGPFTGNPPEIVAKAVAKLGGTGWSRLQVRDGGATARWSAAPTPPSGIAAVELFVNAVQGLAPPASA